MPDQLTFDLPIKTAFGREDFFVTSSNSTAVKILENWKNWPLSKLILIGPSGSGKSHLANIWTEMTNGVRIEAKYLMDIDLQVASQSALCLEGFEVIAGNQELEAHAFHLHNLAQESGAPLLITGCSTPSTWNLLLPDLLSRIQGTSVAQLQPPDDVLLNAVLIKQFNDRQIAIDPKVVTYLLKRMERSFASISYLVNELDKGALKVGKPISIKLARNVLDSFFNDASLDYV
jgi:chromosomal replication initiation ATPase DnaA